MNLNLCKNCKKDKKYCEKYIISEDSLCSKCNLCILCSKEMAKKNNNFICKCFIRCKKCKKILLKNGWPSDIFIGTMCEKCYNLCINCERYVSDEKAIYRSKNKRFCKKCFDNKYYPKDNCKYRMITKKKDFGKLFLNWKKTHENSKCMICDNEFLKCINSIDVCSKCKKKFQEGRKNKKLVSINPSTNKKIFIEKNINGIVEWMLEEEKKKCISCGCSIWIKIKNINKRNIFICNNCNPSTKIKRFKYVKEEQKWILFRELIDCEVCGKTKWIYIDEQSDKRKYCKKCNNRCHNKCPENEIKKIDNKLC